MTVSPPRPSRFALVAVLAAGLALRAALLPLPGTRDVMIWKVWAFAASTDPLQRMYAERGNPAQRRLLTYQGRHMTVDYPPFAVAILGVVGKIYRSIRPAFPNTTALTVAVKLPSVLADAALALVLWRVARRRRPREALPVLANWWLGPAVLLSGAALGYLDLVAALPAVAAFVAIANRQWFGAGLLAATAACIKAQAVLPLGAALVVAAATGAAAFVSMAGGVAIIFAIALAPILLGGAWPAFSEALLSLTRHDMVSGNATNLWWIYTWVFRALYDLDLGAWAAFTEPVRILALSTVEELGHPSPRPFALLATVAAFAWAGWRLWRVRRRAPDGASRRVLEPWAAGAAFASFVIHAYYTLNVQVHENHLFLAFPLALLASIAIPSYRRVAAVIGAVQAGNLFIFYGLSEDIPWSPARDLTVVDTTVLLSLLAVAAFAWHLVVMARLTAVGADPDAIAHDAGAA